MSFDIDMNADYYTDSTMKSSCPFNFDDFVASLHKFLAANHITATGICTMNIQNQNTANKVIVSFSVEAKMMVPSPPTIDRVDIVSPLPGGSGTMFSSTLTENFISPRVSTTPHHSMDFSAWETCILSQDVQDFEFLQTSSGGGYLVCSTGSEAPTLTTYSTAQADLRNAGSMPVPHDQQLDTLDIASSPRRKRDVSLLRAALSILRPDFLEYLAVELPRWVRWGLWEHTSHVDSAIAEGPGTYCKLQAAYAAVCSLQTRIGDDYIRIRIALLELHYEYLRACNIPPPQNENRSAGRGHLTFIIDQIIARIHGNWATLDDRQRTTRRKQFHNHKRYGKRWAVLVDGLGKGVLFLASAKAAKTVYNTAFTFNDLETIVKQVRKNARIKLILDEVAPLAKKMYHGIPCDMYDTDALLEKLRA